MHKYLDNSIKFINMGLMDDLSASAERSPRRRLHENFHTSALDPSQRLLNAIEPDSYIRPHRHIESNTVETLIALRGLFVLLIFDDNGHIKGVDRFGDSSQAAVKGPGVIIPPVVWHTVLSLRSGSVIFETKAGPYCRERAKCFAPWAPPEGSAEATVYFRELRNSVRDGRHGLVV